VFGQSGYETIKTVAVSAAVAGLRKQAPWITKRLTQAGLPADESAVIADEVIARAVAAVGG